MQDTKKMFREHTEILNEERKLLADAYRAQGSYSTNLRWGLGLVALVVAELIFAINIGSPAAILLVIPTLFYAGLTVCLTQREMREKSKITLSKAQQTIRDGFNSLTEKYPAFNPHQPRIQLPDEDQEQSE